MEGDQIFGVHLSIMEYDKYIRFFRVVDNGIIQRQSLLVPDWRFHKVRFAGVKVTS